VVFLNDGEGHFDETQSIRAPADFFVVTPALELADMDGDGFPDLVFGGSDAARIYPNDGTGVFSSSYTELLGYGVPLGVGDLDLDDDLDILKGYGFPYHVFFNDGNLSFTRGDDVYPYQEAFGLADLDGDLDLDIVEGYGLNLGVRLNNGDGIFGARVSYSANNSGELTRNYGLGFGDVDGDGDVDVATVSATKPSYDEDPGSVGHLWLNDGTGSFAHSLILGDASEAWDVAIADVNGDGYGDLLYTSNDRVLDKTGDQRDLERSKKQRAYSLFGGSSLTVRLSNGDGTFSLPRTYGGNVDVYNLEVADFNGDGTLDVALGDMTRPDPLVLFNNGDGEFAPHLIPFPSYGPGKIHVGDVDGDGDNDPVSLTQIEPASFLDSVKLSINTLTNDGQGSFQAVTAAPPEDIQDIYDSAMADINGDGVPDLAVKIARSAFPSFQLYFGNGDGTFTLSETLSGFEGEFFAMGDVDGDGDVDAVSSGQGVLLNNGNGLFVSGPDHPGTQTFNPIELGDVDGDGDLDIVSLTSTSSPDGHLVEVAVNDGNGLFTDLQQYRVGQAIDYLTDLALDDINADGYADLVAVGPGEVMVMLARGDGTFASENYYDSLGAELRGMFPPDSNSDSADLLDFVEYRSSKPLLRDLDGDGDRDILFTYQFIDLVTVLLNDGSGAFSHNFAYDTADGPVAMAAADLNGDVSLDLVVQTIDGLQVRENQILQKQPRRIFVDSDKLQDGSGSSWQEAFSGLEPALASIDGTTITEIWVAEGTYAIDGLRADTYQVPSDTAVYGGFSGTETALDQRNPDPATNATVLSGERGDANTTADNAYHVVDASGAENVVLSGFTLTGGTAGDGLGDTSMNARGGAILMNGGGSDVAFENLIIEGNAAHYVGGAVYLNAVSPTFRNVTFRQNRALHGSPGVTGEGGAMYLNSSQAMFVNSAFLENQTPGNGGAVVLKTSSPAFINSLFADNTADGASGGAIFAENASSPSLMNNTLVHNSAGSTGGAHFQVGGSVTMVNSVVWGNEAGGSRQQATSSLQWNSVGTDIRHSLVANFSPVDLGGGAGLFDGNDPANTRLFLSPANRNFRLGVNSPLLGAGSNAEVSTSDDLAGQPRIQEMNVDIGAFEGAYTRSFENVLPGLPRDGDANQNGRSNFLDYALGSSAIGRSSLVAEGFFVSGNPVFVVRADAVDVSPVLQRSTDLGEWNELEEGTDYQTILEVLNVEQDAVTFDLLTDPLSDPDIDSVFYRVFFP
jgi:hypothetical protein